MDDDLLAGLPNDLPSFLARFGSDARCRDSLFPGALAGRLPMRRLRSPAGERP